MTTSATVVRIGHGSFLADYTAPFKAFATVISFDCGPSIADYPVAALQVMINHDSAMAWAAGWAVDWAGLLLGLLAGMGCWLDCCLPGLLAGLLVGHCSDPR